MIYFLFSTKRIQFDFEKSVLVIYDPNIMNTPTCVGKDGLCRQRRNTPTHVGKGTASMMMILKPKEHSHACGKRTSPNGLPQGQIGTLPRMWEKDCVFTLFARGSVPICIKIFYTFVPTINMADFRICRQKEYEIPLV